MSTPRDRPAFTTHHRVDFHISADPALLGILERLTCDYLRSMEAEMEKVKTALAKARKSLDKLKAKIAKDAETEAAEDEAAAALKADLEAQIAALQKRVEDETITPEEQSELADLVAELDELDGDDEEPEPTPTPPTPPAPDETEIPVEEQSPTPPAA